MVTSKCPHRGARHPKGSKRGDATGLPIAPDVSLVGKQFAGRYHMVRLLGDGGMGAVYKAADRVLRRFVAIKLLHPAVARNPSSVKRFEREARAAAAIGHPNIIDILDFGQEGGRPFMVMEYLRGRSLSQVLALEGPLPVKQAVTIAVHTLAGLQSAHDRGILHRDLKPANLMLVARFGDRHFVKICDFGFAVLYGGRADNRALTPERTLVGTPAYAAPERLRGNDMRDPRIDVYSVGVVLFEMLAGRRPFDAPTFRELARKVRREPPPSLRQLRSRIPSGLERAVLRSLAKDPKDRFPSSDAFAEALIPFGNLRTPFRSEEDSDSFTMEMARIKARERRKGHAHSQPPFIGELVRDSADSTLHSPRAALPPPPAPAAGRAPAEQPPADLAALDETEVALRAPPHRVYSGRFANAVVGFARSRFGPEALSRVLEGMPRDARRPFEQGVDPKGWVAFEAVLALVEQIDARLGKDDLHLVLEAGRAAAEGVSDMVAELRPPNPPPELLVAELPTLLSHLVRGIACHVRRVGRGYGRLDLAEDEDASLTFAVSMLGFVEQSLSQCGAEDVEVNLLSARGLNDPQTLIDISWFA